MKFGIFDHLDRSDDRSIAQQYDERFAYVSEADDAGFYCYHVAEHHATPVNTVPVPSMYLAALARVTKSIRLGPMVFLLPLHSPLRVIEEICILDQLSHGRLEVGIGRGTSPFEFNFHKIDFANSRAIFNEAFDCIVEGLTHEQLTHSGPHFEFTDVPMALQPFQRPHPPFWYGGSTAASAAWTGERGLHFTTTSTGDTARDGVAAYTAAITARGGATVPNPDFAGGAVKGVMREVYVAETAEEARRIAKPAHDHLYANQTYLRRWNLARGGAAATPTHRAGDFDDALVEGSIIAGTPDTVRAQIARQAEMIGFNYFIGYFMFGTMSLADAQRSLRLFVSDVMPHFDETSLVRANSV
jgi:alkanesulfonate monooxygenase SsuD/methylene tetrahydromethanopterin reductase-like flavin-dependent oxidoreductase (luciferase family)